MSTAPSLPLQFSTLPALFHLLMLHLLLVVQGSPPGPVVLCQSGNTNCTLTNAYGAFPDRSTCHVTAVSYPSTEEELLRAVSDAAVKRHRVKVVTVYSHSIPKLSCPAGPDGRPGLLISTQRLNRTVSTDAYGARMTFEAGITLRSLLDAAAARGMALPHSPYWEGVTLGGLLSTGSHGSSAVGKGSAVHEYVVGMRLVVPSAVPSADGYYAKIVSLGEHHPDLLAAKVSLGVLGVISQVTLQLEPMFKRSVTNRVVSDATFEQSISSFAATTPYGDIIWYPSQAIVVYRDDFKLPVTAKGKGRNDFIGFRPQPTFFIASARAAGSCLRSAEDGLVTACGWDPRFKGLFYHQTAVSIPFANITDFVADVKKLRDANSGALCGPDLYFGFLMRFVRNSTAYLGKTEDAVDVDITYYRARDPRQARLHEEVLEEIEQMALFKYRGLPHWGKNRNVGFIGMKDKLGARLQKFLRVMRRYDGEGLFSSEWTDAVLGLRGKEVVVEGNGCALEGLCICSCDEHCAPEQGYYCGEGQVYRQARVCRKITEDSG
ncbi:hypothetical protein ZIOFF_053229 [Zingiber officinale]|uniref:FAD-binding PCMH-type domain-containing protein n=1 Tax=Zingiber officinale TaxID=94328 RepID=A0A8J5FSF2_ZINOF|nr:hypothetical protein ZIOFF_053229 [Zingiber officinale]